MFLKPDVALDVKHVYKKFPRNYKHARKHLVHNFWLSLWGKYDENRELREGEFWALRNISLELNKGETVGLIGLNGSGKSTLLKVLNGTYLPDHGEVNIEGSVGALLELGAGFQQTLSGRENIFIKGALLGRTRQEMTELYGSIVAFAELGEFINSPVGTYSSGMKMRLGFSVAVHLDPDILLMDEVMSVGDFRFRQKCLDKVNEMRQRMSTILVSHSMGQISLFCDRVIVLHKGLIEYEGKPDEAIKYYMSEVDNTNKRNKPSPGVKAAKPFYGDLYCNEAKIRNIEHYWADLDLIKVERAVTGTEVNLVIRFQLKTRPRNLVIGVPIWDKNGNYITGISTDMDRVRLNGGENNCYEVVLNFGQLIFNPNEYVSVVAVVDGPEFYYRGLNDTLIVDNYGRNFGFVTASHEWRVGGIRVDRGENEVLPQI